MTDREKLIELIESTPNIVASVEIMKELADHLIAHGVVISNLETTTMQQWIPVTERLPRPYTPVLTYRQSFGIKQPYAKVDKMALLYDDTPVWTDDLGTWKTVVTHWMPLPEPPKGE